MYKTPDKSQPSLLDFNQPLGLRMNPYSRWVQLAENPYLQYFIGLPGYQDAAPFDASTLVWFRKRISIEILNEANEYMLEHKDDGGSMPPASGSTGGDAP